MVLIAVPALACAHEGQPIEPHDLWRAWAWDPLIVAGLLAFAFLYLRGASRRRGIASWEQGCYWAGWVTLAIALVSPLHALGEVLFSAHMAQHELLMMIAAPLLVLGRPLVPYLWAAPESSRRAAGRWSKSRAVSRVWDFMSSPLHAWWIHFVALWGWHIPRLFQQTVTNEWVHAAQHLSFLLSALLFWWALFRRQGAEKQYGAALLYVFTTMIHTGVLGVLLTFSTIVWYPVYNLTTDAWGMTPLEDQQLGGLIMTVPPIAVYLAAFLVLFANWLRNSDARYRAATFLLSLMLLLSGCGPNPQFEAWELVPGGDTRKAKVLIQQYGCGSCHTIPGVSGADGVVGPPLTKIALRSYLAGRIQNTPENMAKWIVNPKSVDEKTVMPVTGIKPDEAWHVVKYLYTLR